VSSMRPTGPGSLGLVPQPSQVLDTYPIPEGLSIPRPGQVGFLQEEAVSLVQQACPGVLVLTFCQVQVFPATSPILVSWTY
jgi:hypothetical protein